MADHARCDVSDQVAVTPNGLVVIKQRLRVFEGELNQPLLDTRFLLLEERFPADESTFFMEGKMANSGPRIEIECCTRCRWLIRAAWMPQELLSAFEEDLGLADRKDPA